MKESETFCNTQIIEMIDRPSAYKVHSEILNAVYDCYNKCNGNDCVDFSDYRRLHFCHDQRELRDKVQPWRIYYSALMVLDQTGVVQYGAIVLSATIGGLNDRLCKNVIWIVFYAMYQCRS